MARAARDGGIPLREFDGMDEVSQAELLAIFLTQSRVDQVSSYIQRENAPGRSAEIPGDHD